MKFIIGYYHRNRLFEIEKAGKLIKKPTDLYLPLFTYETAICKHILFT
ncbi:hypothetical protein BACPEC_01831 [[Bacteroides] pectinophilus ATCC 43243]|uniref:Uncharacterized protein n=1 Tax=[Bacteroides] pectinophilus ATCC 43243 TaxID=483218 RepID=B7ARX6_9FIRM|nr:hypothetical protein BACPEC_01831 [[Bacteroides] pectinophilus ATCC 43243]